MAKITIIRPSKMHRSGSALVVYCDDELLAEVANGQQFEGEIFNGEHYLQIGQRSSDGAFMMADERKVRIDESVRHITVTIGSSFSGFSIESITED